jgi:light-regulated signal transduction histidine kinase (bacteriophytochrome)
LLGSVYRGHPGVGPGAIGILSATDPENPADGHSLPSYYNRGMINGPTDPKWPRLLSLSVHEFRTPVTVVAGYIRMLLKDRAGALNDQQRRLLEEAEKSCGRLSMLLAEMSELSNLEAGTGAFNRSSIDLHALLAEAIAALPDVPDRDVTVELSINGAGASLDGDPVRLKTAFTSLLHALRRELVTSNCLYVRARTRQHQGRPFSWIAFGDADHINALDEADPTALTTFDEWRGGCGLSLAIARRIFSAHDGVIGSGAQEAKASAVVMLPHS